MNSYLDQFDTSTKVVLLVKDFLVFSDVKEGSQERLFRSILVFQFFLNVQSAPGQGDPGSSMTVTSTEQDASTSLHLPLFRRSVSTSLGSVEGESSHSSSSSSSFLHCHATPTYSPNLLNSTSYPRISRMVTFRFCTCILKWTN